jgi:predicted Rossmann-fold nucleotide-binding protein
MHTSKHTSKHTFVALYDAMPEHAHFESPATATLARTLGRAIGQHRLGAVARMGASFVGAIIHSLMDSGGSAIALSPASSAEEHVRAFRLPMVSHPMIFTGRGAHGADTMALASAHAILIVGSYPGVMEGILEAARGTGVPIGVLSDEDSSAIHERVRTTVPHLTAHLFVSHDPEVIVKELADELRRRELSKKLG